MRSVSEVVSSIGSKWKTEASFWAWLRGGLRNGCWNKHPIKLAFINHSRQRVPLGKVTEGNPLGLVWGGKCEKCFQIFRQNELEVDHIHQASEKPLREDVEGFLKSMVLVTFEDLQLVCKPCHKTKSYAERQGISFDQAKAIKAALADCKLPVSRQIKLLQEAGFPDRLTTNQASRRKCFEEWHITKGE